jgi:hypothetical protein
MTVPTDFYRQQIVDTYARYRRAGMAEAEALQRANDLVNGAFQPADAVLDEELQWDSHSPEAQRWWP